MPNILIIIPLAFNIVAIVFSPFGLAVSPTCSSHAVNNPACGIQFTTPQTIAFTATGYSYQVSQAAIGCETLRLQSGNTFVNSTLVVQNSLATELERLPLFGAVFSFTAGLGQGVRADALSTQLSTYVLKTDSNGQLLIANTAATGFNPTFYPVTTTQGATLLAQYNSLQQQQKTAQQLSQECKTASQALLIITFDATDIATLFIGAVMTSGAIAALSTFALKSGGSFIIFLISSLGLIWLILSGLGFATWATIPNPIGSILYSVLTLMFAIGMIEELGSIIP